jgi:hypothetical protein|tara:strand:+ start:37 stop:294 length:258 start_codon:yes stop_codon:yes gene_type:complete
MKDNIRNNLVRMNNTSVFSDEYIRAEANIGNGLKVMIKVWAELAADCDNKREWNHFAKYVLNEVEDFGKIIKEENRGRLEVKKNE